eukprot:1159643-Pelagomonas_calceolata.AAC.3
MPRLLCTHMPSSTFQTTLIQAEPHSSCSAVFPGWPVVPGLAEHDSTGDSLKPAACLLQICAHHALP